MWLLKDIHGKIKYLKPNNIYNIGRKQVDIVLENDSSISRAHAVIIVTLKDRIRTSEELSKIIIKDVNSKYGTLIIRNGIEMKVSNEGVELQTSDTIKFGLQHHIFKVEYVPFITVISRLSTDHKKKLKDIMDNIGGIVIDYYDDYCTHLTATTATSTNKIISALIAGIPIININYWIAVLNAIEENGILPDPNSFTLSLQDKGVNSKYVSLKSNVLRKTIFQEKTFIFFCEKTYKEYKEIIKNAGGKTELYTINLENISDDFFTDNKIIIQLIVNCITDNLTIFNAFLYKKMQERKLRMVAETEIPLAIMYASLDQFCNPKYHFKELMKRKIHNEDKSKILALDTQDTSISIPCLMNDYVSSSKKIYITETDEFFPESIANIESNFFNKNTIKNIHCILKIDDNSLNTNLKKQDSELLIDLNIKSNVGKIEKFNSNDNFLLKSELLKNEREIENNHIHDIKFEFKTLNKMRSFDSESKNQNLKSNTINESLKAEDTISDQNIKSSNLKSSIKKQNSDIVTKKLKSVLNVNENLVYKTMQYEKSDVDEINKNIQNKWKNKEKIGFFEIYKRRKRSHVKLHSNDDFIKLEEHSNEINQTKQNILNKWRFKKSEKKVLDFDLDDMDIDKSRLKKNILVHSQILDKKSTTPTRKNKKEELFNLIQNHEVDREIEIKLYDINEQKFSQENINEWNSIIRPKSIDFFENNILIKNEMNQLTIRPNIKLGSAINKNGSKVFKKVYNQIPINRITLCKMTIWKPNN